MLDTYASLIAVLQQTLVQPQEDIDVQLLTRHLTPVEACLDEEPALEPQDLKQVVAVLCSWLQAYESFPGKSCMGSTLKILARLLGHDGPTDDIAVQRGLLTTTTALLRSNGGDPAISSACLEILATLSAVESSDKIMERIETVPLIVEVLCMHHDNLVLLEDAVTALALMAKRARHRRTMSQGSCIVVVVGNLKAAVCRQPSLVLAVSRFVINFAVKEDGRLAILHNGGVDALMAAFNHMVQQERVVKDWFMDGVAAIHKADPEACMAVASALWACSTDCRQVQDTLFSADWLSSLAASLEAWPDQAVLHEASLGIVRALSHHRHYRDDVMGFGFVEATVLSMQRFADDAGLVKEGCGVLGNLATDAEIRPRLGECGALQVILAALVGCQGQEDRKVAKLAMGALLNLASCEPNREELGRIKAAPVVLQAARHFMANAHILEYAVGALSHLAVNEACNRQLVEAGAVEALLLFLGNHLAELPVVTKALVALRRLIKQAAAAGPPSAAAAVLSRLVCEEEGQESAIGIQLLVDAMQKHANDAAVVREAACLLTAISSVSAYVPALVRLSVRPCMQAMDLQQQDPAAVDALAGFLASLPLEEDEQWSGGLEVAPAATAAAGPRGRGAQVPLPLGAC